MERGSPRVDLQAHIEKLGSRREWDGFRKGVDLAENHLFLGTANTPPYPGVPPPVRFTGGFTDVAAKKAVLPTCAYPGG